MGRHCPKTGHRRGISMLPYPLPVPTVPPPFPHLPSSGCRGHSQAGGNSQTSWVVIWLDTRLRLDDAIVALRGGAEGVIRAGGWAGGEDRRAQIGPGAASCRVTVLDAIALPADGRPGQMNTSRSGKADAGDANGFRRVSAHNEVVQVEVIGTAQGGLVNDRDGGGTGWQAPGDGVRSVGGPGAGAGKDLIREGIDAVDGNEPAGIAGARGIAEGE